jgi:hypothetical protein
LNKVTTRPDVVRIATTGTRTDLLLAEQVCFVILDGPLHLERSRTNQPFTILGMRSYASSAQAFVNKRVAHVLLVEPLPVGKTQRLCDISVQVLRATIRPKPRPDFDIPSQRLVRIFLELVSKLITNLRRKSSDIVR